MSREGHLPDGLDDAREGIAFDLDNLTLNTADRVTLHGLLVFTGVAIATRNVYRDITNTVERPRERAGELFGLVGSVATNAVHRLRDTVFIDLPDGPQAKL